MKITKKKKKIHARLTQISTWVGGLKKNTCLTYIRGHDPNHSTAKEKKKVLHFSLEVHTSLNALITH